MAGLLKPYAAKELIGALKKEINIPIHLHTANPAGRENMRRIIQKNGWREVEQ